jgi:hypothetical protein
MASKFGRNYTLTVQQAPQYGSYLVVQPPFTMDFDVTRKIWGSANIAKVTVYQLSPLSRNSILKTQWLDTDIRTVQLLAGYGNTLYEVLFGQVYQCNAQRVGTDYITNIESYDGGEGYQTATETVDIGSGIPYYPTVLTEIASRLSKYGVSIGFIDPALKNTLGNTGRGGYKKAGNPIDMLVEIVGQNGVYIDNMRLYVKNVNTPAPQSGSLPQISSDSGLIGVPSIESQMITLQMMFEPAFSVGQQVNLQGISGVPASYTGIKQITELNHRGTISGSVCGEAITTVTMNAPGVPTLIGGVQQMAG